MFLPKQGLGSFCLVSTLVLFFVLWLHIEVSLVMFLLLDSFIIALSVIEKWTS